MAGPVASKVIVPNPEPRDNMSIKMSYNKSSKTLSIGEGRIRPLPTHVVGFTTSGMNVLRKWFGHRKAEPAGRTSEELNAITTTHWYPARTDDLLGGSLLTVDDLSSAS
jgi:hypothetical protein